jgi:hypothetical protein
MPRPAAWLVFLAGMACVGWGPTATTARQKTEPKAQPKVEPKTQPKADPKAPAKTDPKAAQQKPAGPAAAEPEPGIDGPPNPLDLVRGLRQEGLSDLAVELIGVLEKKAGVPKAVKDELPLERARCLLEAADDEPDEATRMSLVGEAKDGFATFLKNSPTHPRVTEAYLSLARLTALEAKAQLARARKIDVPGEAEANADPALSKQRDEELPKQKAAAAAARPLFLAAAKQFKSAADKLGSQLAGGKLDPATRRALLQSKVDAELAGGVNQMALGDTYIAPSAAERKERSAAIEKAREEFNTLVGEPNLPPRVAWVAKAWIAECEFQKDNNAVAKTKFDEVLKATGADADDGKRMARFFEVRHKVLEGDRAAVEKDARAWLGQYGSNRRAAGEAVAVKWYLANARQADGDQKVAAAPKSAKGTPASALPAYREAEKLYRQISQTDNEYTFRAQKRRMYVVRRLLGEADLPPAAYKTFEEAQMASLIQIAKLLDLERAGRPDAEADRAKHDAAVKDRQTRIVALLEHARDIATEKDNPADVTEVLLRLIYFYQQGGHPYRAAVLGEYVARQVRGTGGKSAAAGMLGVGAYTQAATQIRVTDPAELEAARRADRDRAVRLARFLDERFPNDTATDAARYQLAGLLYTDGKPVDAYDATLKVRPGYDRLAYVRLFQGAVATQLLTGKDSPLPDARRTDVYRRTVADLEKLPAPPPSADEDDARTYLQVRARLAFLYLLQNRVDAAAEKGEPGYVKAARTAEEAAKAVGTYKALVQEGDKGRTLDGWEAYLAAEDARTRAVFLEGTALFVAKKYDEVFGAAGKVLAEMNDKGPITEVVKKADAPGDDNQRARVTKLAEGVDKLRRDLTVLALKTRVQQGQADKGVELLDLLKKFGGSIEANVPTLEQLTLEMSGHIDRLRREGKAPEAQALAGGFGKLLEKVSAEPNLPPAVQLFLGQALIVVGEYGKAEEALAKVPRPADPQAVANPGAVADDALRRQGIQYRRAALDTLRAKRMGHKYDEAEKLLAEAMGTKEKQGWAFTSLDFRKEACFLAEARGAEEKDLKTANRFWGTAVKGWTELLTVTRNRLTQPPPKAANGEIDNNALQRAKNAFYDAYFDYNRSILKANLQLLAGNPKLDERVNDTAKRFVDLEQKEGANMYAEVRDRYHDLITEVPQLRRAYEAAGGKLFLQASEN